MKENKTWIIIGIVFFVGAMARIMWNRIGGFKSLPYLVQIVIIVLIPIILFIVVKKERNKINYFQYKLCKLFILFFTVIGMMICVAIVLNNCFPIVWEQYKAAFEVIVPALFLLFSVYMAILTLRNIR